MAAKASENSGRRHARSLLDRTFVPAARRVKRGLQLASKTKSPLSTGLLTPRLWPTLRYKTFLVGVRAYIDDIAPIWRPVRRLVSPSGFPCIAPVRPSRDVVAGCLSPQGDAIAPHVARAPTSEQLESPKRDRSSSTTSNDLILQPHRSPLRKKCALPAFECVVWP